MNRLELDPALNRLPEKIETIHLIGICGTAMAALAGLLVEKGYKVTGSDQNVYPPMSEFLDELGVEVKAGYKPENLDGRPDLVVVGNVVTRQNPESPRLKELGLPYLSLPQTLKHFFLADRKPVVVAGTHGKTTTSSLTAWLLEAAGLEPGFMIGGLLGNYSRNYRLGRGDWFVIEGDEYDTAFFDKVPKFIHYLPFLGILTSVEFDHADIYPDLDAVIEAFKRFVDLIPAEGLLAAWGDDPLVRDLAGRASSPVAYYGFNEDNDWRAVNLRPRCRRTLFELIGPGIEPVTLAAPLPGRHNVLNTMAAAVVMNRIGRPPQSLIPGLESFKGVRRRQEVIGIEDGVTVIDDFAHHPTAVKETVAAIHAAYPEARIAAVFEPRTNTSRRKVFQQDYAEAFDSADLILVREAPNPEKAPDGDHFSLDRLIEDLKARGLKAYGFPDTDALLETLLRNLEAGDVALIMSNGGFDNLHRRLLEGLRGRAVKP